MGSSSYDIRFQPPAAVKALKEKMQPLMKQKDWAKAMEVADFRFYTGLEFPLGDQDYYLHYASAYGEELANRVCVCYVNYIEQLGKGALQDLDHARSYYNNFINCLNYAEFLRKTFPENDSALNCLAYLTYMLVNESGLTLFNAAKKIGEKSMEEKANLLRRTSYTQTRDLHLELINRHPEDLRAKQRLKKLTE